MPIAALRVVVACLWLTLSAVYSAPSWAEVPAVSVPYGSAWLAPFISYEGARLAQLGVLLGAGFALIGVRARAGFAVVTVCGFYLLAIPQFHGGVQHYHHLLWFAALLSVSPASDALAVGQFTPVPGRSVGWGLPTRVAWVLLSLVYFFPGVAKLWSQGVGWAGENLTLLMYWKWAQNWDFVPLFALDQWPLLLWVGGLAVLLLEVGAPLLLWNRRSRMAFLGLAGVFHLGTALFFDIQFWVLWACFVVMWPFSEPASTVVERPYRGAGLMGVVLIAGVLWSGATQTTQGWPFACYPTFDRPVSRWMPVVLVEAADASGETWLLPQETLADAGQSTAFYTEAWGVAGLYGPTNALAVEHFWLRLFARVSVQDALKDAVRVRLIAAERSVVPGEPGVRKLRALGEYELAPR